MDNQIERIKTKIEQLKTLDSKLTVFGSQRHNYQLNPTVSPDQVRRFELTNGVTLPKEYADFITNIGNGGAGPYYGLEPLENTLFDDLDYKHPDSLLDPGKPFIHTEPWNLEFQPTTDENEEEFQKQLTAFDERYYDKELMNGVIAICNFGCAVSLNLVVNGEEYGYIWTDDRGSDAGIYPSQELGNTDRITFLNWYELWLDNSLSEIKKEQPVLAILPETEQMKKQDKKSWWKIF